MTFTPSSLASAAALLLAVARGTFSASLGLVTAARFPPKEDTHEINLLSCYILVPIDVFQTGFNRRGGTLLCVFFLFLFFFRTYCGFCGFESKTE